MPLNEELVKSPNYGPRSYVFHYLEKTMHFLFFVLNEKYLWAENSKTQGNSEMREIHFISICKAMAHNCQHWN